MFSCVTLSTVLTGGCCYHACFTGKGMKSMNFRNLLGATAVCQPKPGLWSPAVNQSPPQLSGLHEQLGPHRDHLSKICLPSSSQNGPILSQWFGHTQLVSKCPSLVCLWRLPLCVQNPRVPQCLLAASCTLGFSLVCFQSEAESKNQHQPASPRN